MNTQRCTCRRVSEFNKNQGRTAAFVPYERHELECALSPDLDDWLFYPHDGELENGGVFVHPDENSHIYLKVRRYLCRVPLMLPEQEGEREAA